ncbi:uncharacterized protein LOC144200369 [Stigmatopora nigra]
MLNSWTPQLLSKFQSLHPIWLSVHWKKKLTTSHVVQCDLGTAVEDIVTSPKMFGLRISGSLLLGVAQIFSRKVKYLLTDCSQALALLQISFRPELDVCVEENQSWDDLSFLQDLSLTYLFSDELRPVDSYTQHQSRPEEITLKEFSGAMYQDESFLGAGQAQDSFGDEESGLERCLDFLTSLEVGGRDWEDAEQICRPDAILDAVPNGVDGGGVAKGRCPSSPVPDAPGRKKRGKRKVTRDLVTTLSDEAMRLQLDDDSDLVVERPPLGPSSGNQTTSALQLLTRPCSCFLPDEILEDFPKDAVPPSRAHPQGRTFPRSAAAGGSGGDVDSGSLWDGSPDLPRLDDWTGRSGGSSPGSEDWPSVREFGAQSLANGENSEAESSPCGPGSGEESSMETQAYPLLEFIRRQLAKEAESAALPLSALWSGRRRDEVARTFLSFLVLCNRGAIFVSQSAPYRDIFAAPRPAFPQ